MKQKLTLLLFSLLCSLGAWADATWSSGVPSNEVGGTGKYYSNVWYLKLTSPDALDVFFDTFTLAHASDGGADTDATTYLAFTYEKFASSDNHKAYEFIAISSNSISGHSNSTANAVAYTFADKVRLNQLETVYACFVSKNVDGTFNLQKRGIAVKSTTTDDNMYFCANNTYTTSESSSSSKYQCHYTCTYSTTYSYPQASEANYRIWSGINNGDKTSTGKIGAWFVKFTAPGTSGKLIQFNQFSLSLRNSAIDANTYLLFSKKLLTGAGVTTSTEFEPDNFAAASTNKVPSADYGKVFTFTFDENSYLECGVTYYMYMGVKSNGNYCLRKYGLYIKDNASSTGFTLNASDAITCDVEVTKDAWQPIYYSSRCAFLDYSDVYTYVSSYSGTSLGKYSNPGYTQDQVTSALSTAATNYAASNSSVMSSYNTLKDIKDGLVLNMPSAPCFLRIQSTQGANAYLKAVDSGTLKFSTTKDDETIFLWAADPGLLISYTKGLRCKDVKSVAAVSETPDYCTYDIESAVNGSIGNYSITSTYIYGTPAQEAKHYLYSTGADNSSADRNRLNDNYKNNNTFTLEAITSLPITMHEVSGAYYATINLPVAVTIPSGLSAYSATAAGDVLTLTKVVEDGVLAANTPVILYSESSVTSLDIASTAGTAAVSNELEGTTAAISVTANQNYVLNCVDGQVGFYLFNGTAMPGFKAYLPSSKTSNVKAFTFSFEDAEDAIRAIESENSGLEIYDISGRRVQKAQKGLYIVNGKKVMYK